MTEPDITLLKKRLWRRCFPVNFAKVKNISFLRAIHVAASVQHYQIRMISKAFLIDFYYRFQNSCYAEPFRFRETLSSYLLD